MLLSLTILFLIFMEKFKFITLLGKIMYFKMLLESDSESKEEREKFVCLLLT